MITLSAATFIEKRPNVNIAFTNYEILKTLQTEYCYRALFLLFCSILLIATLVTILRRMRQVPKAPAGVVFSMVQQTKALNLKSAVAFLILVTILFSLLFIFHLAMALLLQIDLMQDLPSSQIVATMVQSKKTLVGRVLLFDHSVFFDSEKVITEPPDITSEYEITYLANSHIITHFDKIP